MEIGEYLVGMLIPGESPTSITPSKQRQKSFYNQNQCWFYQKIGQTEAEMHQQHKSRKTRGLLIAAPLCCPHSIIFSFGDL